MNSRADSSTLVGEFKSVATETLSTAACSVNTAGRFLILSYFYGFFILKSEQRVGTMQ